MVRTADLPDCERDHLLGKNLPPLEPPAWTRRTKRLAEMRLALVAALAWFHDRFLARPDLRPFARAVLPRRAVAGADGRETNIATEPKHRHDRTAAQ